MAHVERTAARVGLMEEMQAIALADLCNAAKCPLLTVWNAVPCASLLLPSCCIRHRPDAWRPTLSQPY